MFSPPRLSQCHVSFRLPKVEKKPILESLRETDREFVVDGEVLKVVVLLRPKGINVERLRALISFLELSYSFEVSAEEKVGEHTEERIPTTKGVYVFPTHHFSWSCPSLMDLSWQQIETDSNHFALIAEYPIPVSLPRTAKGKEVMLQVNIRESSNIPTQDLADAVQMVYQQEKSTPLFNVSTKKKLQVIQGFRSRYWFTRSPCGSFLCFSVLNMLDELCLRVGFPTLDLHSAHSVSTTAASIQENKEPINSLSSIPSHEDIDSLSSHVSMNVTCDDASSTNGPILLRPKEEYCFIFDFKWRTDQFPCSDFIDPLIETPLRFLWQLYGNELPSSCFSSNNEFLSECVISVRWKLPSRPSAISISFSGPEKVVVNQMFSIDITVINQSQEDILQGLLLLQEKYLDESKSSALDTWSTTEDEKNYTMMNDSTPLHVQFPKSMLSLGRIPKQERIAIRTDVMVTKQGLTTFPPIYLLDKSTRNRWKFEYAFEVFATLA